MGLGVPYKVCGGNAGTGASTLAVTVTHSTALGDLIAVWVTVNTGSIAGVTDSQSNTYAGQGVVTSGTLAGQWWVAQNCKALTASSDTITVTLSGGASSKTMTAFGCSGVESSGAIDQSAGTTGTSASPSVTSGTLVWQTELCIAGLVSTNTSGTVTWGGGFASPQVTDAQHPGTAQRGSAAAVTVSTSIAGKAPVTASGTITSAAWGISLLTLFPITNLVGARAVPSVYGQTDWLATANIFDGYVGRPLSLTANKWYYQQGHWPSAVDPGMAELAAQGCVFLVTFWPSQSMTTAEATNLANAIKLFQNAGIRFKVALVNEPNSGSKFASASAYRTYVAYYAPTVRGTSPQAIAAGIKPVTLVFNPAVGTGGASPSNVIPWYPGDANCDAVIVDFYGTGYAGGGRLDQPGASIVGLATGHSPAPIGFGIGEMGASATSSVPSVASWNAYIHYLTGVFGPIVATGYWVIYWSGGPENKINGPTDYKVPGSGNDGSGGFGPQGLQTLFDTLTPGQTVSAALTATATLTATGQTGGGTLFGAAGLTATATLSATGTAVTGPTASLQAIATLTTSGGQAQFIVQQIIGTSVFDYGISGVEMSSAQGNTLVVLAGWDLSTTPTTAPVPAVYVTDSAGNYWYHVATTSSGVPGARCSAWICPNANSIEWLSVSLTTFASSLAYTVLELAGMPSLYNLDCFDATSNAAAASLALRPGVTSASGFAFSVFCQGALTAPPVSPAGWNALTSATAGGSGTQGNSNQQAAASQNPVQIFPFFLTTTPGVNLATTYTLNQAVPVAGITFAVTSAVTPPVQNNPGFPVLKVEAGFGSIPGDPSQAPPAWTDITSRVLGPEGQAAVTVTMGRQYELAQAEAGVLEIWVDNHDSAFDPTNQNSPFWPGVVLETPIRVSAFWNGQWFAIGYGFVERWPQAWPDLPQWGISKIIATDVISVLAAVTMFSALDSDLLLDAPYVLIPANEQYLSFSNGLNTQGGLGFYTVSDAQGLAAQNYSRTNQRNGMYVDGNNAATGSSAAAIAATGQTTSLLGSAATGFGTTAITTPPTAPAAGPGLIYTDPNIPDPGGAAGVTVSFWVIIPATVATASLQPVVFTAFGPPSNYRTANSSLSVQINNLTGSNTLTVTLADGSTVTAPFSVSASAQQITLVLSATSMLIYVNGSLEKTVGLTAAQTTGWTAAALGCPSYAYASGGLVTGNFVAFDLAIYPYQLAPQRIVSQYATGISGQQNVDALTRVAQILSWANLGVARAGRLTFNGVHDGVLQGPAYNLAGTTAADAVNQVAANHTAMAVATPTGALLFLHKWALFNQSPVAIFGDSPSLAAGEVPYLQATSWDFDNTFLWNTNQVTQQYGANNLFTVRVSDKGSQASYFARTPREQTITTMSALDATDAANWLTTKYSQPNLRVSTVTVDAASNPQVAFPVVLPLQQGQVATVTRRPVGGTPITGNVIIQRIQHKIGPGGPMWQTAVQLAPYTPENSIIQFDSPPFDALGGGSIA